LKTEEDSNLRLLVIKSFSAKMLANFRRKRRNGEKLLQRKRSIYRGKGGSFKKRLDSTVEIFPGDACPLRRSEGDVFYQNSRVFVESYLRSQPASPRG
jgi:hypothetical protein